MNTLKTLSVALLTASVGTSITAQADSNTEFNYGGYIQLDAAFSNYSEGKPNNYLDDFLIPSLIPTETAGAANDSFSSTTIHAKSSRFFFTTKTNTDAGVISSRVELDFSLSTQGDERVSNSESPRIRHAFVKWDYDEGKSLLAGHSWTTFFNVGALPDLLDFVGPVGTLFVRQSQVRWTMGSMQFALENPATRVNQGATTRIDDAETIPDMIARYNGNSGDLSWSLAGMLRQLSYEDRSDAATIANDDSTTGYALSFAGKWKLGGDNDFRFMLNYGNALGRYMGLMAFEDGYVDADGNLETIDQLGMFIAYRHYWAPKWRSNFAYSIAEADNPSTDEFANAGDLASSYQTFHANLNYLPAPKLQLGTEFIVATKERENGLEGSMNRLQFAVKYSF